MRRFSRVRQFTFALLALVGVCQPLAFAAESYQSHPPVRPLPTASQRELASGPSRFVEPSKGDDTHAGTREQPWRTLAHAIKQLRAGETLYLRGGVYHEHVSATLVGSVGQLITIRSYPGEIAILDGGLPEFLLNPAKSWEPCPDGVPGEFWSTKTYPGLEQLGGELRVSLLGNFADSYTPLHGYWNRGDLQSDNPFWTLGQKDPEESAPADGKKSNKTGASQHVYCGPGLWYDLETDRIHCRLAHTKLSGLGNDNYRGETDPRKLSLVVAPWSSGSVLTLTDSKYVRLQDIVLRGARLPVLHLDGGANLELDGLSVYGGHSPIKADGVQGFRMAHTACRGLAAPWTFRGSLKYRSIEARLFSTSGWDPTGADGHDYEIAHCEFTDSVDGVFVGNIRRLSFHHNLVENVSDDGIFVTAATGFDGNTPGGDHHYFQNRFARTLTSFAFGVGHARQKIIGDIPRSKWGTKQLGAGLTICRNVFDYRGPVMYYWPTGPDAPQELSSRGRFSGDHGSPGWEPMSIVHNTLLTAEPPRYEYGTDGFTRAVGHGSRRRIYNNILCQLRGLPGQYLPDGRENYFADGNLLWSVDEGPGTPKLPVPRYPKEYVAPTATWTAHDQFADPQFTVFDPQWPAKVDLRPTAKSPAIDRGVEIPLADQVFDPLAKFDQGEPDVGALPKGVEPWRVGIRGRFDVCGNEVASTAKPVEVIWTQSPLAEADLRRSDAPPAVIVTGYPAFETPLIEYALRRAGARVDVHEKAWLDPREYARYRMVVIDGSFARAKVSPTQFSDDEIDTVREYLEQGGTLLLTRERGDVFASQAGQQFWWKHMNPLGRDNTKDFGIRLAQHPWVAHLSAEGSDLSWLERGGTVVKFKNGETILGTSNGKALLGRTTIGKGQLIYMGFSPAASLPNGRVPPKVADERRFSDQMQIITNIIADVYPRQK